jgi:hypothetical protein
MAARTAANSGARKLAFRIAVHLSDVIADRGDVLGDGVNVAARLQALAEPRGICVHRSVRNEVCDRLPVKFVDMGEVEVKKIARPVRAFRVALDRAVAWNAPASACNAKLVLPAVAAMLALVGFSALARRHPELQQVDAGLGLGALPVWLVMSEEVRTHARIRRVADFLSSGLTDILRAGLA